MRVAWSLHQRDRLEAKGEDFYPGKVDLVEIFLIASVDEELSGI